MYQLKPNSYIDTQATTDQSAEQVGVLRAQWTDGSDSVEVTHVSLTKSSECPGNEFSDLEASHSEEDSKAAALLTHHPPATTKGGGYTLRTESLIGGGGLPSSGRRSSN
ncbi:hypothetical protein LWI29_030359 [Acer saccharum]|uniref:Uncharacterized protein n=1 Tax=Acer saccharum TaxID=4024 RepID=A0AA39VLS0_ACESA|nr:hypothetical protein LWI29_030359 [Acer saccharum]